jgi:4'-phosphopantetheinyl transferase
MRCILAEYVHKAARDLRFLYTEHGKPSLADTNADICFNLSHAGERGILGIARGRDIGVDIENVSRKVEVDNLAKRFFSPLESKSLDGIPLEEKKISFYRIWTCKEAFLKAQGFGLNRSLGSFDIDLSSGAARLIATRPDATEAARWSIVELEAFAGYAAAIAVEGEVQRVNVIRYE